MNGMIPPVMGRLWWIADNQGEVDRWADDARRLGGTVQVVPTRNGHFDVVITLPRANAVAMGWAGGLDSEEWLEGEVNARVAAPELVKALRMAAAGFATIASNLPVSGEAARLVALDNFKATRAVLAKVEGGGA